MFGPLRITLDHVLPNIASLLIVQATISFATAILAEAALSYLGLGTQPPQPSWGRMLNEAQTQMFQAPMLAVYPGVAIVLSGTASVREHVQRLGRILRRQEGKTAILYEVITRGTAEEHQSGRRREHDAYR